MTYKQFKVEGKVYGPGDKPVYQIFGKRPSWFTGWSYITETSSQEEAENTIKLYAKYPQVTSVTNYDENGRKINAILDDPWH